MRGRWAEPGGYQERAELVAVQGDGIGFVVHPRTADVSGGGMLEELFLRRRTCRTRRWGTAAEGPWRRPGPRLRVSRRSLRFRRAGGRDRPGSGRGPTT